MEEEKTLISKVSNPAHSLEASRFSHITEFATSTNYRCQTLLFSLLDLFRLMLSHYMIMSEKAFSHQIAQNP
jgi:hypothetical protein